MLAPVGVARGGILISNIMVVDSIMGSGKTTWAIRHMNEHVDQRFIFITPYLKESERIQNACPELGFIIPEDRPTKQAHFHELLREGKNIAISHELFRRLELSKPERKLVEEYGYTLILDEVLEVLELVDISRDDLQDLIAQKRIIISDDNIARWNGKYSGEFNALKVQMQRKSIQICENNELMWAFPLDLLCAFREVYILTFMFEGSIMEQYLKINDLVGEYCYIADGQLLPGKQDLSEEKQALKHRIRIYHGHLNDIGINPFKQRKLKQGRQSKEMPFSRGWTEKGTKNGNLKQAKMNAYNYFTNIEKVSSDEAMWSILKEKRAFNKPNLRGHYTKSFCPCNCRASNDYRERSCMAYLVDVYCNPIIANWVQGHGGNLDRDNYALSQLLQWMWRSRLRDGKEVSIYIPSQRMRELLESWFES